MSVCATVQGVRASRDPRALILAFQSCGYFTFSAEQGAADVHRPSVRTFKQQVQITKQKIYKAK